MKITAIDLGKFKSVAGRFKMRGRNVCTRPGACDHIAGLLVVGEVHRADFSLRKNTPEIATGFFNNIFGCKDKLRLVHRTQTKRDRLIQAMRVQLATSFQCHTRSALSRITALVEERTLIVDRFHVHASILRKVSQGSHRFSKIETSAT